MCGVVSEDSLWDAQFIGGENKPRVVVPLHSCNNTGTYGLYNQSSFSVSTIAPTSHDTAKFGGLQSPMLIFRHDSVEDIRKRVGNCRAGKGRIYCVLGSLPVYEATDTTTKVTSNRIYCKRECTA